MGVYIGLTKLADDGTKARYAFAVPGDPERTLVFDRIEARSWPEDGTEDGTFYAAERTLVRTWRREGSLPEKLAYQA